jgi:hypothetical protein
MLSASAPSEISLSFRLEGVALAFLVTIGFTLLMVALFVILTRRLMKEYLMSQFLMGDKGIDLKISFEKARKETLSQIDHIRTCVLARELCLIIRTQRAVLQKQDVKECCSLIQSYFPFL